MTKQELFINVPLFVYYVPLLISSQLNSHHATLKELLFSTRPVNETTFLRKLSHKKEMSRNKVFPVEGEEKNTGENEHLETQVVQGNGSVSNGLPPQQ